MSQSLIRGLAPPRPRVRTKRAARRDILRMIPAERPERQTAGMLGHLRATPGSFRDEETALAGRAAVQRRANGGSEMEAEKYEVELAKSRMFVPSTIRRMRLIF